jgi:hypothetical protein
MAKNKFGGILKAAMAEQKDGQRDIQAKLIILDELKYFIPPLHQKEFEQLEKNIVAEGIRETIKAWKQDRQYVLIDGHNRFAIAKKHNIEFKVDVLDFSTIEEVKQWMIHFQLGRRNLNPEQISYLRGILYNELKKDATDNLQKLHLDETDPNGQIVHSKKNDQKTSESLSDQYNVSEKTIRRDGLFAQGLDKLVDELKADILAGNVKPRKSDIQKLSHIELEDKIDTLDKIEQLLKSTPKKSISPFKQIVTKTQEDIFVIITGKWLLENRLEQVWAEKRSIELWTIDEYFEDRISLREAIQLGVLPI